MRYFCNTLGHFEAGGRTRQNPNLDAGRILSGRPGMEEVGRGARRHLLTLPQVPCAGARLHKSLGGGVHAAAVSGSASATTSAMMALSWKSFGV